MDIFFRLSGFALRCLVCWPQSAGTILHPPSGGPDEASPWGGGSIGHSYSLEVKRCIRLQACSFRDCVGYQHAVQQNMQRCAPTRVEATRRRTYIVAERFSDCCSIRRSHSTAEHVTDLQPHCRTAIAILGCLQSQGPRSVNEAILRFAPRLSSEFKRLPRNLSSQLRRISVCQDSNWTRVSVWEVLSERRATSPNPCLRGSWT